MIRSINSLHRNYFTRVVFAFFLLSGISSVNGQVTIFSENMGTPSATTAIASYTGWQNNGVLTFSGTADVRNTTVSSGYTGASGGGNIFFTNVIGRDFVISGINTSLYNSLTLSFGVHKPLNSTSGLPDLKVEVSSDGTTYTQLTYTGLPSGTGTAGWYFRTASGTIPSTSNLRIKFTQMSAFTGFQLRLDDVKLTGVCISPVTYYTDADGDGYGTGTGTSFCANPGTGYATQAGDCNDANAAINPGATETCDGVDNDCDGSIDEGLTFTTYYTDADGDGYGSGSGSSLCSNPGAGYATQAGDCNDGNSAVNPEATEVCNGIDDDCDGQIDEGVTISVYEDKDQDGVGAGPLKQICPGTLGYSPITGDCDDNNASINPGATEICNGVDDNCDGQIDEGVTISVYEDKDNDGIGAGPLKQICPGTLGYSPITGDCDDNNASINPGATEICNGVDDDCDGQIDEGVTIFVYEDKDNDGIGAGPLKEICAGTSFNYSPITGDCDDNNASINPGVNEICNGIDDDCDGQIDEGCGNTTIDYVNLQFPENANILQGGTMTAYAQVYVGGLTDATSGQASGISAWIGYSTVNENPNSASFTWVPATFNTEVGNNDEYQATFGASLPAGTYYYASRFQRNGGVFYYGGYPFGLWNGTTSNNGVLTITAPPTNIDYVNLQFPAAAAIAQGGSITAYAKIYVGGLTDVTAGQAGGISAWIGYSTVNENPNSASFTWVPASFNVEIGNDDEYQATFGSGLPAGIYYFASRFQRNGGPFSYGGFSSGGGNFWNGTDYVSGVLTISLSHTCGASGVHNPSLTYGSVSDIDGNVYKTIQIGNQTWMAENLKTTKYRNGVSIPNVTDNSLWQNNTIGAYCSYDNDAANDCPHGKLYNWYAATNNNQICPSGWHVPTIDEWNTLETYLGGFQAAGGKLKSTGTQYWQSPNTGATNETGFSMLPGGVRLNYGVFASKGLYGYGWSSSENPLYNNGWMRFITHFSNNFDWSNVSKAYGMAIRCLEDEDTDADGTPDHLDCAPQDATKWQTGNFYVDADSDGYGTGSLVSVCYGTTATGYATQNGDCDDNNSSVNPGATEQCNGVDDNCNGQVDEGFTDTDADGSADCIDTDDDNDGTNDGSDCAPLDPTKWQSANLFIDADGDGYTNGQQVLCYGAVIPAGYIATSLGADCNDNDASVQTPPAAVSPITGSDLICYGQTITLSTLSTGGTWSSSNPAVASIDQSGVVTGNTAGTVTIQYVLTNSCGSSSASYSVTVNPQITLSTSVTNVTCPGGTNGAVNLIVSGGTPNPAPVTITQDFNTLVNSGTSTVLPSGWFIAEAGTGANTTYTAGTGSSTTGDTYSLGSSGSTDRALGGLRTGSLNPTFGASFTNTTGATVNKIDITYTG